MRAMLLAAGRGERLRPLTDKQPKPLIEVGGRPLIVHHLERLADCGFKQVVINLGWLGEQIPAALGSGSNWGLSIQYSQEPPGALETAGGIIHALPLLGQEPFAVISGDILCDYPLESLHEVTMDDPVHLVLVDNPDHHRQGDFGLQAGKVVADSGPKFTYSGIALFDPGLFESLLPGHRALRPVLEAAIAEGKVSGEVHHGLWMDIGTAERLESARARFSTHPE
jgi:N-acetyl-alpha-D-muramate 1-phosphate uridylyltransferase